MHHQCKIFGGERVNIKKQGSNKLSVGNEKETRRKREEGFVLNQGRKETKAKTEKRNAATGGYPEEN